MIWPLLNPTVNELFPPNFAGIQLATDLDPVSMDLAPDGRIFLTEKNGKIRIVKEGRLLETPFVTLPNVDNFNERGLLGIVLDPHFSTNHYLYVYYTHKTPDSTISYNQVSRLTANGDRVLEGSELVLIKLPNLWTSGIHNGGSLAFKDGKLLIGVGDNTDTASPQSLNSLKGKILRINPDGSIPEDNPFYHATTGTNRAIWAIGLRNPANIAVQPGTGRVFVNEVGFNSYEEVNEIQAGQNYGWPAVEGNHSPLTSPGSYQDPFYTYSHQLGCAVTGGYFYNPSIEQFPTEYVGQYFFADYCNGQIKILDPVTKAVTTFASGIRRAVNLKIGPDGSLYFLARGGVGRGSARDNTSSRSGVLWKVSYLESGKPVIAIQPSGSTVSLGDSTTLSVAATGNPQPSYQWLRNGVAIDGATTPSYTLSKVDRSDNGSVYRVMVSNSAGSISSQDAALKVINNHKPKAVITSPVVNQTYSGGDQISFDGFGMDSEDGVLPPSAFTWKVDFYHFDEPAHFHPVMEATTGLRSGSFTIPTAGETSSNVLFRIYLTVTDSKGATNTSSVDVLPVKSTTVLTTQPSGLALTLDGSSVVTPYQFVGVSGIQRLLEAPAVLSFGGDHYRFTSWSNGQASSQKLMTPATNSTLVATYLRQANEVKGLQPGLHYAYYEDEYTGLPDFSEPNPVKTGTISQFSLKPQERDDYFAFNFSGYISVPTDGSYVFYTNSDDGSHLYIGNAVVVDNDGSHQQRERSGAIYLQAGLHPIRVSYFERTGGSALQVSYEGPGIRKMPIPASVLFRPAEMPRPSTLSRRHPTAEAPVLQAVAQPAGFTNWSPVMRLQGGWLWPLSQNPPSVARREVAALPQPKAESPQLQHLRAIAPLCITP